jgi:hypothetical protein
MGPTIERTMASLDPDFRFLARDVLAHVIRCLSTMLDGATAVSAKERLRRAAAAASL